MSLIVIRRNRLSSRLIPNRRARPIFEPLEQRALFSASALPRPDHVVVLVEEDHSYDQILGDLSLAPPMSAVPVISYASYAPHLRQLAASAASFTNAYSVGNKNNITQPALFSGRAAVRGDNPSIRPFNDTNIASELIGAGLTFGGYAESLPHIGYRGGDTGSYKVGHVPWVDYSNVPSADILPFSQFPHDYNKLPTVSYVVPNPQNDMHSGTAHQADDWYQSNIAPYMRWCHSHNSTLIVTWDESHVAGDSIPAIFFGPMIQPGLYTDRISQLDILRTIEDMYGLTPTGQAATATPIADIFGSGGLTESQVRIAGKYRPAKLKDRGQISGLVVHTAGPHDNSAPEDRGITGWWVYLDLNGDGQYDAGEPIARTRREGHFTFHHLAAGAYVVRTVQQGGYTLASPGEGIYSVTLSHSQAVHSLVFSQTRIA